MPIGWKLDLYTVEASPQKITNRGFLAPMQLQWEKNLNEADTVSCGLSLSDKRYVKHDWISPFAQDFILSINDGITYHDQTFIKGVVTGHEIDDESELSMFSGEDHLGYFDRRGYPFDPSGPDPYPYTTLWENKDPADILNDIITLILDQDDSFLPVVLNLDPVGVLQNYMIQYGDTSSLRNFIDNFAQGYPGFDYGFTYVGEVNNFNTWSPEYDPTHTPVHQFIQKSDGSLQGVVSGPRWTNTGPGGTHAGGSGAGLSWQFWQNYEYAPSSERYRRLDIFPAFGDIKSLPQLRRATAGALGMALAPIYEITMQVDADHVVTKNGFFNDFTPGAYVFIKKDLKGHMLDGLYKIVQMQGAVSEEGQALVTFNMNRETDLSLNFSNTTP